MKISDTILSKNIIAISLLCLGFICMMNTLSAQHFNGTVKYDIRLTGKDAHILMDNEPAKKMDCHVGKGNYIIQLYEARIPRTFLFINDSNRTYSLDMAKETAYYRTYGSDTGRINPTAVLVKDSVMVKKYVCKVYKAKKKGAVIYYYVNENFRVDMRLYKGKDGAQADFLTQGLKGMIPLMKVIKQKNLTTTIEISSITLKPINPANFQIPRGYDIKIRDPRK